MVNVAVTEVAFVVEKSVGQQWRIVEQTCQQKTNLARKQQIDTIPKIEITLSKFLYIPVSM